MLNIVFRSLGRPLGAINIVFVRKKGVGRLSRKEHRKGVACYCLVQDLHYTSRCRKRSLVIAYLFHERFFINTRLLGSKPAKRKSISILCCDSSRALTFSSLDSLLFYSLGLDLNLTNVGNHQWRYWLISPSREVHWHSFLPLVLPPLLGIHGKLI